MSSGRSNKERFEAAGEKISQQQSQKSYVSRYDSVGEKPTEYKAWSDWLGNVNISNLSTGKTDRFHQNIGVAPKTASRDTFGEDLGQSVGGALQRQGANYKSAGATLLLGAAGLLHGDNNYQPEVGSWLWRVQEGAEADTGVANQLMEDSKYGRGKLGQFAMDLTSGAVDLAGDQLLNLIVPGAGMVAMGARSFGGTAGEQREQGKSISTQILKGAKSAAIEVASEGLWEFGGVKGFNGTGILQGALDTGYANFVEKGGNALLGKLALAFGTEATEEMLSDILNPLADRVIHGVVKGDYDVEDMASVWDIAYDGILGGVLGLLGGFSEGVQTQTDIKQNGREAAVEALRREIKGAQTVKEKKRLLTQIKREAKRHVDTVLQRAEANPNQASQKPVEAQQPSTQQVTPEAVETPQNGPSRVLKSTPEAGEELPFTFGEEGTPEPAPAVEAAPAAEANPVVTEQTESATIEPEEKRPRQRGIGKKAGERLAGAAYLADVARQRATRDADAAKRGIEVDASDFSDSEPAKAEVKAEPAKTGADVLADQARENSKSRLEKMQDARNRALAQNGIDYSYDPREKYWDSELGEYNEIDISDGTHSEEEIAEYLRDMRQIRLLDRLDSWIDRNGPKYFKNGKNNNQKSWRSFENAIRDEVRRGVAQQPNDEDFAISRGRQEEGRNRKTEAGEASREVAQDKADEARLKGKKRTQKFTENGFTAVPIGNGLYRVTGPSGNTSLEVSAADAADAVQKYKDNLTEESRKAAKERKAKEAELKKMRDEVQKSQEKPAQIEGSDGKTYEVTKQLTKSENNYEYVVTELDEDGLPTDMEAEIYRKNASNEEEAVEYAIAHPEYFKDGSVEGEVWEQKPVVMAGKDTNGEKQSSENRGAREGSKNVGKEARNEQGSVLRDTDAGSEKDGGKPDFRDEYREPKNDREKNASDVARKVGRGRVTFRIAKRGANSESRTMGYTTFEDGVIYTTVYENLPDGDIVSNANAGHEGLHGNFIAWAQNEADELAHHLFWNFASYTSKVDDTAELLLNNIVRSYFPDAASTDFWSLNRVDRAFICNEFFAFATSGSALCDSAESAAELDKLQAEVQQFLIDAGVADPGSFDGCPTFSDYYSVRDDIIGYLMGIPDGERDPAWEYLQKTLEVGGTAQIEATNAKEYAYKKKLAGETGVDEEFAKAAMPEDLEGLSERIKSSESKFYGDRKANITKAAEAISKSVGKDASTVLPEELADYVGKEFSKASRDIDGFAKDFLTALATEDDGVALKKLAEDLPKRIKNSKGLKELLGDPEKGNIARIANVLAEATDTKTIQNAASDLSEMIAKEAEDLPKRIKTLKRWHENVSKRNAIARFLSSDSAPAKLASVYFGYQRDMINILQGLDNFDKYGDGDGYRMSKQILEDNFKAQTALGNSIDHVLAAKAEFEKNGGANKTVELKMLKKNKWESHQISLAEAVDFLHTIRTLEASKVNAWQDITYRIGDQKLTMSSVENFNRVLDSLTAAIRNNKAANDYYRAFTDAYAMYSDPSQEAILNASGRTVEMYKDGSYYPLSSTGEGKAASEHDYDFGLDSTRYTQRRVSEMGGVISITDPATRFNAYAHTASNLVARASVGAEIERLSRGGLGPSITDIVEERYGKGATDTVKQYIKDSSNYRMEDNTASSLFRQLRLNIQGGALFGNFGSMLKQFPSVYNAAGILDFDSITHGIIAQMNAGNRKRAAALGSIKTRHQGNLDPSVAETLNENSGFKKAMEKLKILKFAKEGFEIVDSAAIRSIYLACEYQVEVKDNISRDAKDFDEKVMSYFVPAFLQTQPQFEKTLRPYVQTSESEFIRMFGMFKTQPLRNLNTMMRTVSEYNTVKEKYGADSKEFKATEKQLRTTIAGQASASLMFGALGVLAKLLYHRNKDLEDKEGNLDPSKIMSRILMNAAEAAGGSLVFGDAAVQLAIDMASGGKTNEFYGLSAGAVSSIADSLDAITTFVEKPNANNAKKAAGYIATLFGIPLNNAYAVLNSAIMYTKDIAGDNEGNYDDILKYLDAQAKVAAKEEAQAAKQAEKSGADMLAETAQKNAPQSDLNSQEETNVGKVSTYLKKPYQALLEAGMSSERSRDLMSFIDTDDNDSIKQSELLAFYKDNPNYEEYVRIMWNSYGWKTTWEKAKAKVK